MNEKNPNLEGDWRHFSACIGEDPELFFPIGNTGPAVLQAEEAKRICMSCDARVKCLEWAMQSEENFGIWGGLTEGERQAIKRRSKRSRVAPE
ncbi:WhiB family transcriptional regulator [Aeromicrobium sp.]|nr:WhiB family transcriptional regulator [Candidatus Saccharibacteria bacterium]